MIESVSAVTLATHNMSRAVAFYRMLGFEIVHGGDDAAFTSFQAGTSFLNLVAQPAERNWSWWGRVIFYHSDVDTSSHNPRSEIGLGGDVSSSTIPTSTPSMRA